MNRELEELLGLNGRLAENCPYGSPPAIEIESSESWTINGRERTKADPYLCQLIIVNADACATCPLNHEPKQPSDYLSYILELDEIITCGAHLDLPFADWKAIGLLKRKRNEAEIKRMKEKSR
jgi:hypothetical protein